MTAGAAYDPGPEQRALTLPGDPQSARQARRFVQTALLDWGLEGVADDAALLTSELATNAVLHARTGYEVLVERAGTGVRVSVLDDSAAAPVRRHHDLRSGTGRGIALVETLATRWGSTPPGQLGARRKGVWFELEEGDREPGTEGAMYGEDWLAHADD